MSASLERSVPARTPQQEACELCQEARLFDAGAMAAGAGLWHLGRPGECVAALDATLAAASDDEASLAAVLREQGMALPPGDWDAYLPIARATWFNRSKCETAPR